MRAPGPKVLVLTSLALCACFSGAGTPRPGAGDAGEAIDASNDDAATDGAVDASSDALDAGASCANDFADCTSFVDAAAGDAGTIVTFQDFVYAPKCLQLRAGQTAVFQGDFVRHPLRQACGPAVTLDDTHGTVSSFTFTVPGVYGYYCLDHGNPQGQVMSGTIRVVP